MLIKLTNSHSWIAPTGESYPCVRENRFHEEDADDDIPFSGNGHFPTAKYLVFKLYPARLAEVPYYSKYTQSGPKNYQDFLLGLGWMRVDNRGIQVGPYADFSSEMSDSEHIMATQKQIDVLKMMLDLPVNSRGDFGRDSAREIIQIHEMGEEAYYKSLSAGSTLVDPFNGLESSDLPEEIERIDPTWLDW